MTEKENEQGTKYCIFQESVFCFKVQRQQNKFIIASKYTYHLTNSFQLKENTKTVYKPFPR